MSENQGSQFDRLPATAEDREVEGRATRREVIDWWTDRFGLSPEVFEGYTLWEKGAGKVWILAGDAVDPTTVEAMGMVFLRTRQEHWKPTTDAVQRFFEGMDRNVVDLSGEEARRFVAGEDQEVGWDGDWGYLVAARETGGTRAPIGVGLYVHGELKSTVPKGRRREF